MGNRRESTGFVFARASGCLARRRGLRGALAVFALLFWWSRSAEAQTPLVCGQVANGSIDAAQELDVFTFTAEAGDMVTLTFLQTLATDAGFSVSGLVYTPTGTLFANLTTLVGGINNLAITQPGTYTLRVSDSQSTRRGSYVVGLTWLLPLAKRCGSQTTLGCGQVANASIEAPLEFDLFTFTADAGDIVTITFLPTQATDADFAARGLVYTPAGALLANLTTLVGGINNLTITQPGTYTLRVSDSQSTRRGSYVVGLTWLLPLAKRCGSQTTLGCGQVVNASIEAPLEFDLFTFTADAGDIVTITFLPTQAIDADFAARGLVYTPAGALLANLTTLVGGINNLTITQPGTYTLRVSDGQSTRRGSYVVGLTWLLPLVKRCGSQTSLGCGQVVNASIEAPLEFDLFTFAADAGDRVTLTFLQRQAVDPGFASRGFVYTPTGTLLANLTTLVGGINNLNIAQTGVYTVRVSDAESTRRGSYSLGLTWLLPLEKQSCDIDMDTLPDAWESQYGLDPNSSSGLDGRDGDPDGDGLTNLQELQAGKHPRGFFTRYLAEGALNAFFDVRLALLNVGTESARVQLRLFQPGGTTLTLFELLPAGRRRTLVRADLAGLVSPDFSTVVESDQRVVLDRTMTWDARGYGSHAESGVAAPATTWYLAEGSTSTEFALFYLLQNPNSTATTATIRYLRPFGQPPIDRTYPLAPSSRTTIPVDDQGAELASTDLSAIITAPQPIIVERAMYISRPGQIFAAGHGSAGVTAPATSWFLAEGATGPFFDLFILLANPNDQAAQVTVDYLLDDGTTYAKSYQVPANGRFTIWVDDEQIPAGSGIKPLGNVAVSSTITSTTVPIIVERSMWWPGPALSANFWTEAHNSPGATVTGARWALAEGEVGGSDGAETYILIANTSASGGNARVTLYFEDGTTAERTFALLPRSRTNVAVSTEFPSATGRRFGAVVESLGATPAQIVVERAMYTSPGGVTWAAGTNALATRLP
jgi:hypothetical protein